MTHPNSAKGSRWELAVRRYLEPVFGRNVRRPRQEGTKDVGDLHLSPFVLQCKDEQTHRLPAYIRDAEKQAGNAGESFGVAVVKARGKPAANGYVVMSLETFRRLAERLEIAERRDYDE